MPAFRDRLYLLDRRQAATSTVGYTPHLGHAKFKRHLPLTSPRCIAPLHRFIRYSRTRARPSLPSGSGTPSYTLFKSKRPISRLAGCRLKRGLVSVDHLIGAPCCWKNPLSTHHPGPDLSHYPELAPVLLYPALGTGHQTAHRSTPRRAAWWIHICGFRQPHLAERGFQLFLVDFFRRLSTFTTTVPRPHYRTHSEVSRCTRRHSETLAAYRRAGAGTAARHEALPTPFHTTSRQCWQCSALPLPVVPRKDQQAAKHNRSLTRVWSCTFPGLPSTQVGRIVRDRARHYGSELTRRESTCLCLKSHQAERR